MACVQVLWLLLATDTVWPVLGQSVPTSPCPTMFWYEADASGNWHGRVIIPSPPAGSTLTTVVELHIDAVLRTQNVGELKLLENENEVWRRISNGNMLPLQFYVHFPLSWPLPVLRSITSNGNVICIGNTSQTFLTKVILQYILYPTGGNTYEQQNQNVNQQPSDMNYYQYIVTNTKNDPVYGLKPRIEVQDYDTSHSVSSFATCPGVFDYQQSSSGEWYGRISVQNPYPILAINIKVEIYVTGDVPMISRGSLQLENNLIEEWNRMRTGEKFFIRYKLEFPVYKTYTVTPPLPTIKNVIVNNRALCSGGTPSYSIVAVLSYQHSIFSDRCTSSSLKCPYNIEQSALPIKPATPTHQMTTQIFRPTLQVHTSSPPTHVPTSEFYKTTSQVYEPSPRAHEPTTKIYDPSPPPYQPTSEVYERSSLKYETTPQTDKASTSTYKPTSHTHRPSTPDHKQVQDEVLPEHTDSSKKIQCGTLVIKSNPLVAHGEETFHGQWPWHAALYLYQKGDFKFRCGGSFVGTRTVITAAHCVNVRREIVREDFVIYLGMYKLRDVNQEGSQYHDVSKIVVHPSYNSTTTMGDIAVLILSAAVKVTAIVRPVCLWSQDDSSSADIINQVGLVVGWGLDERDEPTDTLMMVKMPVVSQQTCIWSDPNYYSMFTSNGTFCAGYRNGSSVCNGDSGGGMVFRRQQSDGTEIWMLRGIVSHGRRRDSYSNFCDTKGYIVFTDVAQYLDWIYEILI